MRPHREEVSRHVAGEGIELALRPLAPVDLAGQVPQPGKHADERAVAGRRRTVGRGARAGDPRLGRARGEEIAAVEIGRAHVCTPVTNAHLVCRLLLAKTTSTES